MGIIRAVSLVFFAVFCLLKNSRAQLQRIDSVPVFQNSIKLKNPWAGGLNFVQFSEIDLNNDNSKDLFVFDRTGNKIRTFINEGITNTVSYKHAPQYEGLFPEIHDWVILADYNCDGKEDIFTYSNAGMAVYRNTSSAGNISFKKNTDLLLSYYGSMPFLNLYISPSDIPAIVDVDNDGDLDILTFGLGGTSVELHKNTSIETQSNCDTLLFARVETCWGVFEENFSNNSVTLNISCKGGGGIADSTLQTMHSGSTLCAFDADCDGDKELLLGDISSNYMNFLTNGGDLLTAQITAQDANFPSNNVPVNLTIFPAAFYLDVNNNGQKDLLISPNNNGASENYKSVKFYEDTNSNCGSSFKYRQSDFLQDGMIELGEGSYPLFFDYDSDGDYDLVLGNFGYWKPSNAYKSGLSLYKNTGSNAAPVFSLINTDYCNLSGLNVTNIFPAFGDLDGDGDKDMIVGDSQGRLHYYKNVPLSGEANFTLADSLFIKDNNNTVIDVGNMAAPFLYDLNNDGLLDLVIGSMSGNIIYYQNIGTSAVFNLKKITNSLGGVDVRSNPNLITGYSTPFLIKDNGQTKLLVGSERGYIYYYTNIDGNLTGTFTKADSMISRINDGIRNAVSCYPVNNTFVWANGNYSGGVALYAGAIQPTSRRTIKNQTNGLLLYPNPVHDVININFINNVDRNLYSIRLFDSFGRLILNKNFNNNIFELNVENLSAGLYIITVLDNNGKEYLSKFVKQ